jgi:hypothetical protein
VKVRTKILLLSSAAFLCFYVVGITETGQDVQIRAASSAADPVAIGSGVSPLIYGLLPFFVLLVSGLVSWFLDRR